MTVAPRHGNRALVTGATGLVGSTLVERLRRDRWNVIATSRGNGEGIVRCELPDVSPLVSLAPFDVVFHCAASIRGGPEELRRVNVEGSGAIADLARRTGAILVHVSSTDVLAATTSETPVSEDARCAPHDAYGRSKLEAERRVLEIAPEAIVVRPPGIWGPRSRGDAVMDMARKIARRRFFHVGDGSARRSWVHAENLAAAMLHLVEARARGVFHVDDGAPVSRRALAEALARGLGVPAAFPHVPIAVARAAAFLLRPLPNPPLSERHVRFRTTSLPLDSARLRATGFVPKLSLDEAVRLTVPWWRATEFGARRA